jgi:hypothetical protein
LGKTSLIVIVIGVFSLLFAMLYFSSVANTNEVVANSNSRNATLENAIRISDGLNETKVFKELLERYDFSRHAYYITYNVSEDAIYNDEGAQIYLQGLAGSGLPGDKPMITVIYEVRLDVENRAVLAVFLDPQTYAVYHIHQHRTYFG